MRYEDMLSDPLAAFTGLTNFLQIDAPAARVEKAVESASFDSLRALEERYGFAERSAAQQRFFRQGQAGSWRDTLAPGDVKAVVAAHREQMDRFNYVPDGL